MIECMDVSWDFMQPQFQRALLCLADQDQGYAGARWADLSPKARAAVEEQIRRMSSPLFKAGI